MATKKRTYSIEINGVKESLTDFDKLSKEIDNLSKKLKTLKSSKVEIPINIAKDIGSVEKTIKDIQSKLSKNKINPFGTNSSDAFNDSLSELNKTITENQQSLSDINAEINTNERAFENAANSVDDLTVKFKDISSTVKNLIADLNSLNKIASNIDSASDEYKTLTNVISDLNSKFDEFYNSNTDVNNSLKNLTSNINNTDNQAKKLDKTFDDINNTTKQTAKNLKDINDEKLDSNPISKYGNTLKELEDSLDAIRNKLKNTALGTSEWSALNQEAQQLTQTIKEIETQMEAAVRAEDQLNTKIKVNINGMSLAFDDVNQAIGILEDKLYALSAAGKSNTTEFANIQSEIVRLRREVVRTDAEIDSLTTTSRGLDKVLGAFRGFTAIAGIGEGISSLFGENTEITESIQRMTALLVILESIATIQEEINKQSSTGRAIEKGLGWVDNIATKLVPGLTKLEKTVGNLNNVSATFEDLFNGFVDFNQISTDLTDTLDSLPKKYDKVKKAGLDLVDNFKEMNTLSDKMKDTISKIATSFNVLSKRGLDLGFDLNEFNELFIKGIQTKDFSEAFKYLDDIKNKMQSFNLPTDAIDAFTDRINDLRDSTQDYSEVLDSARNNVNNFNTALSNVGKAAKLAATALKTLARATIILAIIEGISRAISGLIDGFKWLYNYVTGADEAKLIQPFETLQASIENTNKELDKFKKNLDTLNNNNVIDTTTKLALSMEKYEIAIKKAAIELQNLILARDKFGKLEDNLTSGDTWFTESVKSIDDFQKRYEKLMKAVQLGKDENLGEGFGSWFWFTADDAKSDLAVMQKTIIKDIQNMFTEIDLTKSGDELEAELEKVFSKLDTEMYATAFANIENLFPEEDWAKVLKARVEQVREMYDELKDLDNEYGQEQVELAKRIRNNYTEAIADERERAKKQLEDSYQDEIKAAANNEEEKASIDAKYARLRTDLEKETNQEILSERISFGRQLLDIEKMIRDNELEAQKESLDKRLQSLANSQQDEIDAINQQFEDNRALGDKGNPAMTEELKQEAILSVQKKYDKFIQDEIRKHNETIFNIQDEYAIKQKELMNALNDEMLNNKYNEVENAYRDALNSSEGDFDFSAQFDKRIEENKKFYDNLLQIELKYIEDKKELDKLSAENEANNATFSENNAYQEQLKNLKSMYENGEIELEDYNQFVESENQRHSQALINIMTQKNNTLSNIESNYLNDIKEKTSASLNDTIGLYQNYVDEAQKLLSQQNVKTNIFGIPKASDMIKNVNQAKDVITQGLTEIDKEYANLDKKLSNKEITFVDYKQAREQLDQTKEELETGANSIGETLTSIFEQTASSYMGMINGWVSSIGSLLSTMNETQLILIDNQLAEIEHQLEIQQDAYDKAEEAAEAHKDKMDEIEEELSEARGSRKQFLLETLAAQQNAYLEELAAQEEAERKKEALEKKQQALEKKRKEQEKKSQIQQAIINTYTAVTNALAVQPWFVGVALSAVALAMGMANVAAIKSTPIYREGGLLEGKSHEQGGIKVLDGRAEVEGGEYIVNKKTTSQNLPMLEYVNSQKRPLTIEDMYEFFSKKNKRVSINKSMIGKYENGGQLPTLEATTTDYVQQVMNIDNRPIIVDVRDIIRVSDNLNRVQVLSGTKK